MLVIMKKKADEPQLQKVKKFLVDSDCDFHQSTGVNRIILGVVGNTEELAEGQLRQLEGVLDVYRIPDEDE